MNDRPGEPMSLAVLPNGRVLHTARTGQIRVYNPNNGLNTLVINMADTASNPRGLYQHDEEGVQGIAVDPNFEDNHWVYLYYSPRLEHAGGRARHGHQRGRRAGDPEHA